MKIQTEVLKGLLVISGGSRNRPHLQSLRVSNDAQWLVAANGLSLAMGAITQAEDIAGQSFSGLDLDGVCREASRRRVPLITLAPDEAWVFMWWDPPSGEIRTVRRETAHPLPPTENLISTYPLDGPVGNPVVPGLQFTKAAKAVSKLENVFIYPKQSGTWFIGRSNKSNELRVLVLHAYVAESSWPK